MTPLPVLPTTGPFPALPSLSDISIADILADTQGIPLRFDPDNHPAPPRGNGFQLNYRALPQYEEAVKDRQALVQLLPKRIQAQMPAPVKALLEGKNQPIPITNEHQVSYLYLQEYYKKQSPCDIQTLDAGAILNILAKASLSSQDTREQAAKVRDMVRNKWAHAVLKDWTDSMKDAAFTEMEKLAKIIPLHPDLLQELDFSNKEFLLNIDRYKKCIKDGNHEKIQTRIKKLASAKVEEIYIERKFKETSTGLETSDIEKLVMKDETVLLKAHCIFTY